MRSQFLSLTTRFSEVPRLINTLLQQGVPATRWDVNGFNRFPFRFEISNLKYEIVIPHPAFPSIQIPKSKIQNQSPHKPSTPPPDPARDELTRRLHHFEKLDQLREARAAGRPHCIWFDSADGPLPPPPPYIVDGAH